ncbi:uncharacterized protein LOC143527589 [Brachyhypopomus gauderio]|uniref:uncharacterized protein LOC143527589 n=1 Tax=Brachyhypopomus gauderio TaxID=698409 RepID=UPI004041576D
MRKPLVSKENIAALLQVDKDQARGLLEESFNIFWSNPLKGLPNPVAIRVRFLTDVMIADASQHDDLTEVSNHQEYWCRSTHLLLSTLKTISCKVRWVWTLPMGYPWEHAELNISVVQSPDVGRVPPGESVSLQCSVLSERRTAELQVFWFRSSAGDSHPEIISTHHNSSRQCEISSSPHSCVYNLSKSVLSVSDTGTYYCAVLTCGKILLGNGTTVCLTRPVDALVFCLGAALGVSVAVVCALVFFSCKKGQRKDGCVRSKEDTSTRKPTYQDSDVTELNYIAVQFSGRQTNGKRKRSEKEQLQNSVYSEVVTRPTVMDQHRFH